MGLSLLAGLPFSFFHPFILLGVVWFAYWDVLKGHWVSDDHTEPASIANYDGTLQKPISWHNLFKKFRYEFGKYPNPNKNWQKDKQPPFLSHPTLHHRLNLWTFSGTILLLYMFLSRAFNPSTAFLSCLLFTVHPLGAQTIGWISGIGYVTSAFWMLLGLNVLFWMAGQGWCSSLPGLYASLPIYLGLQWMAVEAQFAAVGAVPILWWLGFQPFAIAAGGLAIYQCLHTLKEAVMLRSKIFKEQKMEHSITFHPKKLFVVLKSFYYNTKLILFPKRLGLYHTFFYHYDLPDVEAFERYALFGLGLLVVEGLAFWLGPPPIRFGLLWCGAFSFLFYNWITANQFVVDRYMWLPSLGWCLIAAVYLPAWGFWGLMGVALMRVWTHLPTFFDEIMFYYSNILNFPTSEIAFGNLGVAQMKRGLFPSALDSMCLGLYLNREYDVNWFNIGQLLLTHGILPPTWAPAFYQLVPSEVMQKVMADPPRAHVRLARWCLEQAVNSRTCHFPEPWKKQLEELDHELIKGQHPVSLVQPLIIPAVT